MFDEVGGALYPGLMKPIEELQKDVKALTHQGNKINEQINSLKEAVEALFTQTHRALGGGKILSQAMEALVAEAEARDAKIVELTRKVEEMYTTQGELENLVADNRDDINAHEDKLWALGE